MALLPLLPDSDDFRDEFAVDVVFGVAPDVGDNGDVGDSGVFGVKARLFGVSVVFGAGVDVFNGADVVVLLAAGDCVGFNVVGRGFTLGSVSPFSFLSDPLTGFDFFVELRPEIEKNSGTSETFSELKNLTEIFPDIKDYADASSSIALLQVPGY